MLLPLLHASMVEKAFGLVSGIFGFAVIRLNWEKKIKALQAKDEVAQKENQNLKKQLKQKENENASLIKAKEEILQRENEKALFIKSLKNQLEQKDNENAFLIKAEESMAQKEYEKALLARDLKDQLEQKEDELASLSKAKEQIAQKECEKVSLIMGFQYQMEQNEDLQAMIQNLQNQLGQKENETAFLIKAKEEIAQKDYAKALLIWDLQNQLGQKESETAFLIKAKEEIAQKDYAKALLIWDLQNQLGQKENETAFLIKAKEEIAQKENQLTQRIHLQPQVDAETWQFEGDSGEWVSFPDCANKELMVKFVEGHEVCQIVIDGKTYEIDLKKFSQINVRTKKERQIRCFFDLPSHWQMTNEDALKFRKDSLQTSPTFVPPMLPVTDQDVKSRLGDLLNKSLSRHDGSDCNCLHGSSNYVVTEAFQVNNLPLWRRYQRFVRSMQDKHKQHGISLEKINPSVSNALTDFAKQINADLAGNERLLLHGTGDLEVAKLIATEGFDNRIARNGLFGRGTYFAAQTCKSAQHATPHGRNSKASPQMIGTMLIARVAIGDPFYTSAECSDESRPPEKNGVRADSIIAKPGIPNGQPAGAQSHMEVVTFDPAQAYPEFIVRFTEE